MGAYFVTICTKDRACLFGEMANGEAVMNVFGEIVRECWNGLPRHYGHVGVDAFVVMPNHVHGIVMVGRNSLLPRMVSGQRIRA